MKKETVNTFSEGLNKDLNPIVTPNNVLTDNLNGTFITFNGDELSLQNDAGNTKLPGPDDIGFVKLSDGFYPIGIKEYGGVLYIVSGKKGLNDIGGHDPSKDEIEFGSYPSPENSGYTTFHGERTIQLLGTKEILYKSYIINNDYFKTGRFISFDIIPTEPPVNLNDVQTSDDLNKLYIIKLLLQLDNGTLDLTEDVWAKFNVYKTEHPEDTATHWILSSGFEYYCPYSYKGRLAVQVVMSEPTFKLIKINDVDTSGSTYSVDFEFDIQNTSALFITGYKVTYNFDTDDSLVIDSISVPLDGIIKISDIPIDKEVLHFNIIPKFTYNAVEITWDELPLEFQQLYNIHGIIMLSEKYRNLGFNHEDYECIPEKSLKIPRALALVGQNGYITPDLSYDLVNSSTNPTGLPYALLLLNSWDNGLYKTLGTFEIIDKYPRNINITDSYLLLPENNILRNNIIDIAQKSIAEIFDPYCSESTLHLRFSAPLDMTDRRTMTNGYLTIYQDNNSSPTSLPYDSPDGRNFYIKIDASDNVHISFSSDGFGSFTYSISKENLDLSKPYEIGLAVKFENEFAGDVVSGQKEFNFMTADIDLKSAELGNFIHNKFSNNISNRYKVMNRNSTDSYLFTENRISFMEGSYSGYFYLTVRDEGYISGNTNTVSYYYRLTDQNDTTLVSNILPEEYAVITKSGAPRGYVASTADYVKIGDDSLGYVLFKIQDVLNIARVISRSSYPRGTYGGENRSGRSSGGSRTSSRS